MTIERVVDVHVHLWDPARADWYPYLAGMQELNMGDISGMCTFHLAASEKYVVWSNRRRNFPVDGMHGTFDDLFGIYDELTADLDQSTRYRLFAENAERIYGC